MPINEVRIAHDRDFVGALEKGLLVIEAFGPASPKLTLSEVARRTELTRAAARRYLLTLVRLRYAETDGKLFWLAPRVLRLGHGYLVTAALPKLAQPIIDGIGERTQEVASIAILESADIVFLAHSGRRRVLSAVTRVGTRMPAYCTAMGRVLLAPRSDAEIERFLKSAAPRKLTEKTKVAPHDLLAEIRKVRADGYAVSDEELEIGLRSIAVPITDSRGEVVAAMSVSLQAGRMTVRQMIDDLLPELEAGRRALAAML